MGWFFHFCLRIFQKCLPLIFDDSFIFVAEKTTIPNNLHELNCCERWSILLPWICWHCLTQQVVLEPIGFNLSFCIDKGFLGSGFWQSLRLLNILANLILSRGYHSVLAISSTVTYVKLIFGWYLTNSANCPGRQFSGLPFLICPLCSSRVAHCPGQKTSAPHNLRHIFNGILGIFGDFGGFWRLFALELTWKGTIYRILRFLGKICKEIEGFKEI